MKPCTAVKTGEMLPASTLHRTRGTGITTTRTGTTTTRTTTTRCSLRGIKAMQERSLVTLDDIYTAYEDCRRKKKSKRGTKGFAQNALFNCIKIVDEINERKYLLKPSECFIVSYPKPREVFCAAFRDRVVQHFVYNELNPVIEKLLINDTCSCRTGKGTDYAIKRVIRKLRQATDNYSVSVYLEKIDLSGFFMSIIRGWLCALVIEVINVHYYGRYKNTLLYLVPIIVTSDFTYKAKRLVPIERWNVLPKHKSLFGSKTGLPIGNITSQLFANYALNSIDHYIKSRHKYYVRYVDDMYLIDESKEKLIETRKNVESMLMKQGMRLNNKKSIIQRSEYGISFLGVVVKPYYAILGKQRINRIYKCSHEFSDPYKAYESSATRKGMFERYKGYRIAKRWYESFPEDLKKYMYMNNSCKFVWLGEKPQRNRLLISLEEEDMKYKIIFSNGTAKIVDHPNFIKMNPRYPSFICCGRDDAECVMLQEGEESVCYNIAVKRYPEYDVVDVRAV